jgi:hypothetical protein
VVEWGTSNACSIARSAAVAIRDPLATEGARVVRRGEGWTIVISSVLRWVGCRLARCRMPAFGQLALVSIAVTGVAGPPLVLMRRPHDYYAVCIRSAHHVAADERNRHRRHGSARTERAGEQQRAAGVTATDRPEAPSKPATGACTVWTGRACEPEWPRLQGDRRGPS